MPTECLHRGALLFFLRNIWQEQTVVGVVDSSVSKVIPQAPADLYVVVIGYGDSNAIAGAIQCDVVCILGPF